MPQDSAPTSPGHITPPPVGRKETRGAGPRDDVEDREGAGGAGGEWRGGRCVDRGGRDKQGHSAMRRLGGGQKRMYRIIDFKRNKFGMNATVR
mgnify:CR=1 FL=1